MNTMAAIDKNLFPANIQEDASVRSFATGRDFRYYEDSRMRYVRSPLRFYVGNDFNVEN